MTRDEHLFTIAMEECAELAQRISKAARFGMEEVQPGQALTNRARLYEEYFHLRAALGMIGLDAWEYTEHASAIEAAKVAKVEHFLAYSSQCGTLTANGPMGLAWTTVKDEHPKPHARYYVRRDGLLFTATPCYGLHEPWWVVRTMADQWPNEADPVGMRESDQWCPVEDRSLGDFSRAISA